jgi:eukaryotic-like serine/threonine-protein kinase
VDALDSTDPITSVQEVPLVYLESISNHWQNEIGFGGFGTVYEGIDMEANFEVAIKVLRTDALSEKHKTYFETEIEVSSGTLYFHIWRRFALTYMLFGAIEFVQVEPSKYCPYILGKTRNDHKLCVVLEYAAGGSLHSILSSPMERSELSPSARLYIAQQGLTAAVEHMHMQNMLHRDIKPQNVCLNDGWKHTPKATLIDFGIAKSVSDMQANSVMTSNPGSNFFKAPVYMKQYVK